MENEETGKSSLCSCRKQSWKQGSLKMLGLHRMLILQQWCGSGYLGPWIRIQKYKKKGSLTNKNLFFSAEKRSQEETESGHYQRHSPDES